jgi:hypothetical protein
MADKSFPPLLTPAQLAARWQISPELLAAWRYRGDGPPFVKLGHHVRYPVEAVLAFEVEGARRSTGSLGAQVQNV